MPRADSAHHYVSDHSPWRFRISHLFLLTLGVALGLSVWRLRGQPAINFNVSSSGTLWPQWTEAPLGLRFADLGNLLVPVAFWATLGLLRAVMLQVRGRKDGDCLPEDGASAVRLVRLVLLGRLVLAGCLALFVALTIDLNTRKLESANIKDIYEIREQWLAQAAAMLLFGWMLGRSATRPLPPRRPRRRRLASLFFPGTACPGWVQLLRALLLGGLVLAVMTEAMIVPYLGIIAVLLLTLVRSPADLPMERVDATFGERFGASVAPVVITVALALVCIGWVVHVTKQSRRGARAPSVRSWSVYVVAMLLLLTAATNLVFGTVPYLSRFLAESFAGLLEPVNVAIGLVGAGGLSFGLAARGALRPRSAPGDAADALARRGDSSWLLRLGAGAAIGATAAACVYYVHSGHAMAVPWPAVEALAEWTEWIGMGALFVLLWMQPTLWAVGLAGMAIKLLIDRHRLATGRLGDAPPERSAEHLPLLWMWWPLITVLLVAAVPILGVAGLLAFHATVELGW